MFGTRLGGWVGREVRILFLLKDCPKKAANEKKFNRLHVCFLGFVMIYVLFVVYVFFGLNVTLRGLHWLQSTFF